MAILVNNTKHAIVAGSVFLIPLNPLEVGDFEKLKSLYPALGEMVLNGDITVKEQEKAKEPKKK